MASWIIQSLVHSRIIMASLKVPQVAMVCKLTK